MGFFRFLLVFVFWALGLTAALAQEDDKGFLTRTIQDALSGAGRTVSIDGFKGALSSSASFEQMTIADRDGIWLTLDGVELVWNRSALLRGRLEVEKLTAQKLDIPRLPLPDENALPQAEATPFSLPELPVSVELAEFAVQQINLGAPLLGETAQLSVQASARLTDAVADVDVTADRTDGKRGSFAIRANYDRTDNILDLLVNLSEGEEGIAAKLLNLPGQPSVDLQVAGKGPLDDFATDVVVATEGRERLAGQITIGAQAPRRATDTPDRRIQANIGGDITALLAPRYRAFFGDDVRLTLDAVQEANGALSVDAFALEAQSAQLQGKLALNAESWPVLIDIEGQIVSPDGTPVILPTGGEGLSVEMADLIIAYDASKGDAVKAVFDTTALVTGGNAVGQSRIALDGTLQSAQGNLRAFDGDVTVEAAGIALSDPALSEALGDRITGAAAVSYAEGQPTQIDGLTLTGTDYGLSGMAVVQGLAEGFATQLDVLLKADDLSRFSALAGQELDGRSDLALAGQVTPLSGEFDVQIKGTTQDLAIGVAQADALLRGRTVLDVFAKRTTEGTFLRDLSLRNAALDLSGDAELRSENSRAELNATLKNIGTVLPQYSGPVQATVIATQDTSGWRVEAQTDGPYRAVATVNGAVTPAVDIRFDLDVPEVRPLAEQLSGPLKASGTVKQTDKGFFIDTAASGPFGAKALVEGLATGPDMALTFDVSLPDVRPLAPGVSGPLAAKGVLRQTPQGIAVNTNATGPYATRASVQGVVTGPKAAVDFTLAMPNIGAVVDKVNGPLNLSGSARKQGSGWRVDTDANGPSGTQANFAGLVNTDGTMNATLRGDVPLGLSRPFLAPRNLQGQARFDLAINGPPALSSLSGTVQTNNASFTAPNLRVALNNIAARVQLGGNRAVIEVQGQAVNGGTLRAEGAVTLTPALPADLNIALRDLVLIDPQLYQTSLRGALRLAGPLTGGARISGQIDVGETTVNVPSTGMTSIGDIPQITHIGATRPVLATRKKAGLNGKSAGTDPTAQASGPGFGLDVLVNAPRRIFVRGRGLDAELGGNLKVTGNTNRVISTGAFELIRGRLDILGKRFNLVEGSIFFLGDLLPYIRFVSATDTKMGEARVIVEGSADDPKVSFESTPDAPQDEVLAQLLFDRNLSDISAFQALQLAGAVATLAGRGGGGVISNLRDGFGLDDFDVTTNSNGATAVRAGKYISENVYTDITAASDGTGEVSLNLDLTPNLKAKGTLGSDGNSGLGIFFEKDY